MQVLQAGKPLLGKRVAVLVETEYIPHEIEYYRTQFPLLGAQVDFLCHLWTDEERRNGKELVSDVTSPGQVPESFLVTLDVADANVESYDIVIMAANYCAVRLREIPPMGSLGSPEEMCQAPAVAFYADAMRRKNIAKGALCHALWILTPCPQLLQGRRVICHTVVLADIVNAGATFVADPSCVVIDDDLVTARSAANLEAYFQALVATCLKLNP